MVLGKSAQKPLTRAMENFESVLDNEAQIDQHKRPTFLTVLCILTFVGSGFGIVSGLISFTGINSIEDSMKAAQIQSDPDTKEVFKNLDVAGMQKIQSWVNILSLLASVLCLAGALVMWRLKKFGFVLYVAGHAATIFGTYIALGIMKKMGEVMPVEELGGIMETMGAAVMVFTVLISVGFIIMYGVNLKAMNK
jgi:hypothetical protein